MLYTEIEEIAETLTTKEKIVEFISKTDRETIDPYDHEQLQKNYDELIEELKSCKELLNRIHTKLTRKSDESIRAEIIDHIRSIDWYVLD